MTVEQIAKKKVEERARAKTDKLFLATEVLGYDFCADVHAELFGHYIPFDPKQPWVAQSDIKRRLILWSRGHYKTTSIVVEIIQAILCFPDIRILIMQGSLKTTKRLLREIASHFTGDNPISRLPELFPEFCGTKSDLELTADSFTVPARRRKQLQQATVTVASPRATKTGQHYDAGFFDDLINDQNYRSQKLLQKALEDFTMCIPLIDPGCYFYVTGTRYAFGDLYEVIIRSDSTKEVKEWVISVKTCWTDDGKDVRFPQRIARDGRIIGFTREGLLAIQATDPGMFASQYLNQPASTATELFTDAILTAAVIAPLDAPALSQAVLFVDLASSGDGDNDDSVVLAAKVDSAGRMYVVDITGGQWTPAQLAVQIIMMALKHRPLRVMIEKTASCTYFVEYLQVIARGKAVTLPIDFIKISTQTDAKNVRVTALEGYMRTKRLFFFSTLLPEVWDKMLVQFKRFPKNRHHHDDYPDTVALMAQHFAVNVSHSRPAGESRHPLLEAMERQQHAQELSDLHPGPAVPDMGDDFACS